MELEPLAWRGPLKLAFGLFGLQILHCKNYCNSKNVTVGQTLLLSHYRLTNRQLVAHCDSSIYMNINPSSINLDGPLNYILYLE